MTDTERTDLRAVLLGTSCAVLRARWAEGLVNWARLGEASDRSELEHGLGQRQPAVVFVDVALPGLSGLDGLPDVQRLAPEAKFVVLDSAPSERQAVLALVAGARGYCDRNTALPLVRKAIEVVHRGEVWIGRDVVPHLLQRITAPPVPVPEPAPDRALPPRFAFLAPRERQIALLVGAGANNKEIAAQLSITEATVKAHLTSVFRKLHVSDRLRLALFVTGQRRRGARGARGESARMPRSAAPSVPSARGAPTSAERLLRERDSMP